MPNRLVIAAMTALSALVLSAEAGAEDIDPKIEKAIRVKAAEVLNDPFSAVFTFDVVRISKEGASGKICGAPTVPRTPHAQDCHSLFRSLRGADMGSCDGEHFR